MRKSLRFARYEGFNGLWVVSNYTGEINRPWEIRKIFGMVLDFFRY